MPSRAKHSTHSSMASNPSRHVSHSGRTHCNDTDRRTGFVRIMEVKLVLAAPQGGARKSMLLVGMHQTIKHAHAACRASGTCAHMRPLL